MSKRLMAIIKSLPLALTGDLLSEKSRMGEWNSTSVETIQKDSSRLRSDIKHQRQCAQSRYLPRHYSYQVVDVKLVDMQQDIPFASDVKAESVIIIS
jgi:hypothetical protein